MDNLRWKENKNNMQVLEEIKGILSTAKKVKPSEKYVLLSIAAKWNTEEGLFLPEATAKRISLASKYLKLKEVPRISSIEKAIIDKKDDKYVFFRIKEVVLQFKDINNLAAYRIVPLPENDIWFINIDGDDIDDYEELKVYKTDKYNRITGLK